MNVHRKHQKYERLLARAKEGPPITTAVVHPCDESSLLATVDAAKAGLIAPILVGPRARRNMAFRSPDTNWSTLHTALQQRPKRYNLCAPARQSA
jgi:hypothetical protein